MPATRPAALGAGVALLLVGALMGALGTMVLFHGCLMVTIYLMCPQ